MPKVTQSDFSGGMTSDVNVSLVPPNTVSLLLNCDADVEIGSVVSRYGTATRGAQLVASQSVLGLIQHIDTDTANNNKLFATINASGGATSVVYDVVAGTTSVTGLTASKKMRSMVFLGSTLFINGTDVARSYTSAGFITTGGAYDLANLANIPSSSGKISLCVEFLDRVYLSGDTGHPTRVYYSGVSDGSTVSWTSGNDYVDIEAEDGGGPITALSKVPGYVLIFKERSLHRWNFSSAFPESLVQIGTPNQESVVMGGGLCAFYSNSNESAKGFYLTNGDRPICISQDNNRPLKKWVDAIATANEASIAGWATDRHFCWSVGDMTVDGETYNNVVFRYNRILNQWSIRTYPQQFTVFTHELVSGVNTIVGGADDGTVYRMDKSGTYTDASTTTTRNFSWKVRQNHLTYGDNRVKTVGDRVVTRGKNIQSARVSAFLNENLLNPVTVAGKTAFNRVLSWFGVSSAIKGSSIAIEVAGESSGAQSILREIEIPSLEIDESYT